MHQDWRSKQRYFRQPQGMYDPQFEHDNCGVGIIANVDGHASHDIVRHAEEILLRLTHRGACGCDNTTGDGAGMIMQLPDEFFRSKTDSMGFALPPQGEYGVGMLFLPHQEADGEECCAIVEQAIRDEGQTVLGWRDVPVSPEVLGEIARANMPWIRQVFIGRAAELQSAEDFERKLYVIRKVIQRLVRNSGFDPDGDYYAASMSCKTITYKGLLISEQLSAFYPELADLRMKSALALAHRRFSTNTMPSWALAQPFRRLCHNGEINAVRGNRNWMHSREPILKSELLGEDLQKIFPVLDAGASDSANVDNVVELMALAGRPLHHALKVMIPEAWENNVELGEDIRAFYDYHSILMEPWDGPALIGFTDGDSIGALLDRNGLRPARYTVTKDGLFIMGSETGVLDVEPSNIESRGRIDPGNIVVVNTREGRIDFNASVQRELASRRPYKSWISRHVTPLDEFPIPQEKALVENAPLRKLQKTFGYTREDQNFILAPMIASGKEAVGSMGNDAPPAVLSDRPQLVFNYFKQHFAQVTNPPIDPIREKLIMSLVHLMGVKPNLLREELNGHHYIRIARPALTNEQLVAIRAQELDALRSITISTLYTVGVESGMEQALERMFQEATAAINEGYSLLILSDRGVDESHAPIPSLLACSAMHHHLLREQSRTKAALIIESGEPREVHHFAMLVGYGADCVNPYLAYETIREMIELGLAPEGVDFTKAQRNYLKALDAGLLKTISRMGISTLQSYRGAQIFEAVGLGQALIDQYFTGTASRVGGCGLAEIQEESSQRHRQAFPPIEANAYQGLEAGGEYAWRRNGERHLYSPETIALIRHAVRTNSRKIYREYAKAINEQSRHMYTIRGLLDFRKLQDSVPLDEVEPAREIVKRFATGAMSFGSISKEAHETLAIAMNRIGGKSNTGEGGEDPRRFKPDENGDLRRSAIKQVASARFGVSVEYLVNADELQIKIAQGAKPGEGGQLPGRKVDEFIAKTRNATPGVGLISPPPHHDIYSIEDLAQLIQDLKNVNPHARINVKLVSCAGVGTVAAGVAKAKADAILISGYDGGTGASPLTSIRHAGTPWELGLSEAQQTLVANGLRSRVVLQTDGKLKTGRDVVIAALLGAEEFGFATSALVAEGCIMMRKCHLNTCPVGIATQDPELRKKFEGKPEHVINLMFFFAEEMREIMAELGFRKVSEMVGQTQFLEQVKSGHPKARHLDLSKLLHKPEPLIAGQSLYCSESQDHALSDALDKKLIQLCEPLFARQRPVDIALPIANVNRAVGSMLSGEITRRFPGKQLAEDIVRAKFKGSAGQSFGAWLTEGVTFELEGDSNDYVGKGLSGGKVIVYPPADAAFDPSVNVIIGNVALYGAIDGELYVSGLAGERFAIRNSGAQAVVEGVGDHGCEYMTGGTVAVLGPVGRNFGAGMSGGIAYVYDMEENFRERCNRDEVDLEDVLTLRDKIVLKGMIKSHLRYTGSERARQILSQWEREVRRFVKVFPCEYRAALVQLTRKASEKEREKEKRLSMKVRMLPRLPQQNTDMSSLRFNTLSHPRVISPQQAIVSQHNDSPVFIATRRLRRAKQILRNGAAFFENSGRMRSKKPTV
ncbi:glutamate synthase large subunit [Candidatus Sumerlaeota bacterium]|nr:glutamate synthase large subunit [Candidatus Sumerlaeota bacterium]